MCIVLVVEDDEGVADTIRETLEEEGHEVYVAGNGRAALVLLERIPRPRLMLIDRIMPEMDGAELAAVLAEKPRWSDIPRVFMSALRRERDLPPDAEYLAKPFSLEALLETIKRHCGKPDDRSVAV